MDQWNDICSLIEGYKGNNFEKDNFKNAVENIFELLGWSHSKNELDTIRKIGNGSNHYTIPDVILRSEGIDRFVVEFKKQSISTFEAHILQLVSNMIRLRLPFGLFIGASIHFYYDVPCNTENPIKLIKIDFTKENEEGRKLIALLKKDSFDEKKLIDYCEEKLVSIRIQNTNKERMNFLASSEGRKHVLQLIADDLQKNGEDIKIIDDLINKISIHIKSKIEIKTEENSTQKAIFLNLDSIPDDSDNYENEEEQVIQEINMVKRKIPVWLRKPHQQNSQIFIRFMKLLGDNDFVKTTDLYKACVGILNVSVIKNTMSQWGSSSNARIFDIKLNEIRLWKPIEVFVKDYYKKNYKP